MRQDDSEFGSLSEDELRLIAFYRSQNPRVREILMNITYFETDYETELTNPEATAAALAMRGTGKSDDSRKE